MAAKTACRWDEKTVLWKDARLAAKSAHKMAVTMAMKWVWPTAETTAAQRVSLTDTSWVVRKGLKRVVLMVVETAEMSVSPKADQTVVYWAGVAVVDWVALLVVEKALLMAWQRVLLKA